MGIGSGTVAFDYGSKTYRFGERVDEAEAKQIVQELGPHVTCAAPAARSRFGGEA